MQPAYGHAGIDQSAEGGGGKAGQNMVGQKPGPMLVEHRAPGQARPWPVRAPPGERAHPLPVPGRSGALPEQHRGKVVPVVERQLPFRVDQRVGGIGDQQHPAAGDQRLADRSCEPRRERKLGVIGGRGAVWPADRRERVRSRAVDREQSGRVPGKRRDDAKLDRVARKNAPLPGARLELERNDGRRVGQAGRERDRRRLAPKRGFAALPGEPPVKPRALRRVGRACEPHGNLEALAGAKRRARRPRDHEPRPLQFGQALGESARAVANIHEAVQFPLRVVELGDDIAGNRPLPAQRLDLIFQPAILKLLRGADEAVEIAEDRREMSVAKARFDPVRISGAEVPVVTAFEPPRLASVPLQDLARMGQPPDAEFRADERLIAAPLSVAMRRKGPGRAAGEGARRFREGLVLMGKAVIPMEVLDLRLEMIVAREAGRIVDDEARGDEPLRLVEGLDQPAPVVRIVVEIDSPALVDQRPDANRGMSPVRRNRRPEHPAQHLARRGREELHVGHVEPDDEAEPVGEIEIELVGNLDVAAQRVEAHRLGVQEALFEKLCVRRAAFLFGMPVLIEGAEHGERLAVEQKAPLLRLKSPKSDHALDRVDGRVANEELDDEIVQVGRVRRPRQSVGKGERRVEPIRPEMIDQTRDRFAAARQSRPKSGPERRRATVRR